MREFYLKEEADLAFFLEEIIPTVKAKELVVLDFGEIPASRQVELATTLASKTEAGAVKMGAGEIVRASPRFLALQSTSMGFVVQDELTPEPHHHIDPALVRDAPYYHRSLPAFRWADLAQKCGARRVIPEIGLNEPHLDLLFPTLAHFAEAKVPFVLLEPAQLSLKKHSNQLREQLMLLQMTGVKEMEIQFTGKWREFWDARTDNLYAGPHYVDIDVANTCTHNCVFCGLYGDSMIEEQKRRAGGTLPAFVKAEYATRIHREHCLKLIHGLPETVKQVQFGGKGDPFTHPNIMEFIEGCRNRNILVSLLTNYAYMTRASIERLQELSSPSDDEGRSIEFIVNLSAATAGTYLNIRPNQKESVFHKVVADLKYSCELRDRAGFGVDLVLMSVTNRLNYHEIPHFVALAHEIGINRVWIKPMEVHGEGTLELLVDEEDSPEYADLLLQALFLADLTGIHLMDRPIMEAVVQKHAGLDYGRAAALLLRDKSKTLERLELDAEALRDPHAAIGREAARRREKVRPRGLREGKSRWTMEDSEREAVVVPEARAEEGGIPSGVMNGDVSARFLDRLPCKIGYQYLRIETRGKVLPCCIANYPVAKLEGQSLAEIWFSHALNTFRQKMEKTPTERFHRKEKEWAFCQQCIHLHINRAVSARQGFLAP